MIKKIAATGLVVLNFVTYSTPASAVPLEIEIVRSERFETRSIFEQAKPQETIMSAEYIRNQTLMSNGVKIDAAITKLKKYVNKTWYVFSGNTPSGWDCSGLTMWFYEQLGIELEHRASKQEKSGTATKNPMPGDLVVFKYKGYKSGYHVGIYIGDGQMIHAPRKGEVTRIESVEQFGGNYSNIVYVNFIERL
jgi:hypothetical protein